MLLELLVARGERRYTPVKCLWLASGAPRSTALRWVQHLERRQLVRRISDPDDGRRQFIVLDERLARRLVEFLRMAG